MTHPPVPIEALRPSDLQANPVWRYVNSDRAGETALRPVMRLPVSKLTGKVIGTQVRLANGNLVWALLGNLDGRNPRFTEHYLTLSVEKEGRWFTLARYHDFDYPANGPPALARFLGLPVEEVFPVTYDVRAYAKGDRAALAGEIPREPRERLTIGEIIGMSIS